MRAAVFVLSPSVFIAVAQDNGNARRAWPSPGVVWPAARNCAITTERTAKGNSNIRSRIRSGTVLYSQKQSMLTGVVLVADSQEKRKQTLCPSIIINIIYKNYTHIHIHIHIQCLPSVVLQQTKETKNMKRNWFANCSRYVCVNVCMRLCVCVSCVLFIGEPRSKYN